ncbi:MAG: hypothetical protein AAFV51_14800, partial [Pseudomonadota bacterium]
CEDRLFQPPTLGRDRIPDMAARPDLRRERDRLSRQPGVTRATAMTFGRHVGDAGPTRRIAGGASAVAPSSAGPEAGATGAASPPIWRAISWMTSSSDGSRDLRCCSRC